MENILGIIEGFKIIFNPSIFIYMVWGFFLGSFFGAVPGLTQSLALALVLPMTYGMDVVPALVMCMAITMGGSWGGSITAVTINIPGAASAMMTSLDGYPMMLRGEGAKALGQSAFASMIGGSVAAVLLMITSPFMIKVIFLIKTPGRFSLILFALIVVVLSNKKSLTKGLIATMLGIMLSTIGIDQIYASSRFTFGINELTAGIDFLPFIIGVFAISELLIQFEKSATNLNSLDEKIDSKFIKSVKRIDFIPTKKDLKDIGLITYVKSMLIGYFIGALPACGSAMAAFIAYGEAKRSSKNPEKFGTGILQGIAAPETANNAVCSGALVPMLTFGIPGSAPVAIVLGVLLIHGLQPGPRLLTTQFHLVSPMYASLFISAIILLPLTLYILGPYFMALINIERKILYSSIALVALIGSYVSTYSIFQMLFTVLAGVIGYIFKKQNYPNVSLLMGFILGPMIETYFRRSLAISRNNPLIFFTSLDSIFFLLLTVVFLYTMGFRKERKET